MRYTHAVQRLMAGESPMTSYAGNFEDVILARVFEEQTKGFYVDVGAHHPVFASNTYHFYRQGWNGINIEPSKSFEAFPHQRTRDVNLNIAVSDSNATLEFEECEALLAISQLSASDPESQTLEHLSRNTVPVQAKTLVSVLDDHLPQSLAIDFMSVDVEGHERAVLASNDWNKYRPRVLCVEATLPFTNKLCHHEWDGILIDARYEFAYFDGVNRFYVAAEESPLLEKFQVPLNVLDHFQRIESLQLKNENRLLREFYEKVTGKQFEASDSSPAGLSFAARCGAKFARGIRVLHNSFPGLKKAA